jgi:hypothetical protein
MSTVCERIITPYRQGVIFMGFEMTESGERSPHVVTHEPLPLPPEIAPARRITVPEGLLPRPHYRETIPVKEFKGDPRRVPGHPSNPATYIFGGGESD